VTYIVKHTFSMKWERKSPGSDARTKMKPRRGTCFFRLLAGVSGCKRTNPESGGREKEGNAPHVSFEKGEARLFIKLH